MAYVNYCCKATGNVYIRLRLSRELKVSRTNENPHNRGQPGSIRLTGIQRHPLNLLRLLHLEQFTTLLVVCKVEQLLQYLKALLAEWSWTVYGQIILRVYRNATGCVIVHFHNWFQSQFWNVCVLMHCNFVRCTCTWISLPVWWKYIFTGTLGGP